MPAKEILKMATKSGYEVIGEDGGIIEEGKKADFITIDLDAAASLSNGESGKYAFGMCDRRRCM